MTRKLNKTVTATVTCDACGDTWEEEESVYNKDRTQEKEDLCEDCKSAYHTWKAERRKSKLKLP